MSIKQNRYYGLNANKNLNEILNKQLAVENLGLNIKDLESISGLAESGATRTDIQTLSSLDFYIQRRIRSLSSEVSSYEFLLETSADFKNAIRGNLEVYGTLGSSAIKFKFLDETDAVVFADLSTSKASSWSSTGTELTDPQFYNNEVEVSGKITANSLKIKQNAEPILFQNSEQPTHKIEATINGSTVYLYAMKNIPLQFAASFRNLNGRVDLLSSGSVSWRIVDINNPLLTVSYENQGGNSTRSILNISGTSTRQKVLEIYHNPDNISLLSLPNLAIESLPSAQLSKLRTLDLSNNSITTFPDLTLFSPNLESFNIYNNNLKASSNATLRTFNENILARIPNSITSLSMGRTFGDQISINGSSDLSSLSNLITLNLDNSAGREIDKAYYGAMPIVSDSVQVYSVQYNYFDSIPDEVKNLPNLTSFNIYYNSVVDSNVELPNAQNIRNFDSSYNTINIPNMANRDSLDSFRCTNIVSTAGFPTEKRYGLISALDGSGYKFQNCSSLRTIELYNTDYYGPIPKFTGNTSLVSFGARATDLSGGIATDDSDEYIFYNDHFDDCAESLRSFRVLSPRLLNKPIHPEAFIKTVNLSVLEIVSQKRGVSGGFPQIFKLKNLRWLIMYNNNFSGPLPATFEYNPILYYVHFYNNNFSGPVPAYESNSLGYLYLHRNQLTQLNTLNCPNLLRLFVSYNQLSGSIPDLSSLIRMYDCFLNNNQLSDYTIGSFVGITRIRSLDISSNLLTETSINNIMNDLYLNYESAPRSNVTVNITGNAAPSGTAVEQMEFLRSKGWSIRT